MWVGEFYVVGFVLWYVCVWMEVVWYLVVFGVVGVVVGLLFVFGVFSVL